MLDLFSRPRDLLIYDDVTPVRFSCAKLLLDAFFFLRYINSVRLVVTIVTFQIIYNQKFQRQAVT